MPGVASTSGRLQCQLLRPLFFPSGPSGNGETSFRHASANQPGFFPIQTRGILLWDLRGKWDSSSRRLLPCASTSTPTAALSPWAAHTHHTACTLLASSPPPFLNTSSLPAPVIKCPWGLLIPSPSALALCSTLLLFLSFTLSRPSRTTPISPTSTLIVRMLQVCRRLRFLCLDLRTIRSPPSLLVSLRGFSIKTIHNK